MKKSTLALSIAAAITATGFAGSAMAIGVLKNVTGGGANVATTAVINHDGIGHNLLVPYFSTQSGNVTLLNITNTDQINGKLVKVRFRGAANSDDIFDFTLMLSPADVWTAAVSQDPTTGVSTLRTTDASCVVPSAVKSSTGALFITGRVDPTPSSGTVANQTREGYIEIINMADVPPTLFAAAGTTAAKAATLYGTTKHTAGVAACDTTVLSTIIGTDYLTVGAIGGAATESAAAGIEPPTGLLTSDWVILNQTNTAAWSGSASAIQVQDGLGANGPGILSFWPQLNGLPLQANSAPALLTRAVTADPLFTTGVVTIQNYDLPDSSTPLTSVDATVALGLVTNNAGPAATRADATSALLAVQAIQNQFATASTIGAVTDLVFSQPTRRYSVAVNYKATSGTAGNVSTTGTSAAPIYRGRGNTGVDSLAAADGLGGSAYYGQTDAILNTTRQVCTTKVALGNTYDREESKLGGTSFVISPGVASSFALCGEAAVASINSGGTSAGSALNATVVRNDITFGAGFDLGTTTFTSANGGAGMPILGFSAVRVANGAVNYGFTSLHKNTR